MTDSYVLSKIVSHSVLLEVIGASGRRINSGFVSTRLQVSTTLDGVTHPQLPVFVIVPFQIALFSSLFTKSFAVELQYIFDYI